MLVRLSTRALLLWAAALPAGPALGQGLPQQVEVTAQPQTETDQRRRDPVAKTIVGRDELDKYADPAVSDVLKRLPGVSMQGGSPRLRGLGGSYTLVLVNGEPAPPGFSLDQLSPSQVERIEITRGPSAEHSAQAVAGTINIILREAPRTRQRELSLRTGWQAVRPVLGGNASWGDRSGALSYAVPLSVYQWRGQADTFSARQAPGADGQPQQLRTPGTDEFWGGGFNLGPRLTWKLGEADSIGWQTFAQRHDFNNQGRQQTTVLQGLAPLSVDDRFTSGGYWQMLRSSLQWNHKADSGLRLELKAGFQASSSRSRARTDGDDAAGSPTLLRETTGHNTERSTNASGKASLPLGEAHTLALGWELEQRQRREQRSIIQNGADQLPGIEGLPFDARISRGALFVQDEWVLSPRWSTSVGLRAEQITTRASGLGAPVDNSSRVVTPVWHLTHKFDPKGRDLLRASLTRSYKAPELAQLSNRPGINTLYPVAGSNVEISPDSMGNPALQPELATGLDLAFEHYLPAGGVLSIGGFHRRISGLIRQQTRLQTVAWSAVPRWVSLPVNLDAARSTGVELELKGRGDELWADAAASRPWLKGLSLRASASVYRSSVDGIPGPDDRLVQQQPWSAATGFDQVLGPLAGGPPLTVGASLAWTPGFRTQQTPEQAVTTALLRTLDAYALWAIDRQTTLRLGGANLLADGTRSSTILLPGQGEAQTAQNRRASRRSFNANVAFKF
ncbi:MAG: TonB-dependent receptor [Aquabacterium sp.]|nr:TonB-dependent receptor [Aquabacterium sp.]